jgi:hypothetical protein
MSMTSHWSLSSYVRGLETVHPAKRRAPPRPIDIEATLSQQDWPGTIAALTLTLVQPGSFLYSGSVLGAQWLLSRGLTRILQLGWHMNEWAACTILGRETSPRYA